jgi:Flp pilus assembly protein TadB
MPDLPVGGVLLGGALAAGTVLAVTSPHPGRARLRKLSAPDRDRHPQIAVAAASEPTVRGRGLAAAAVASGAVMVVGGLTGVVLGLVLGPLTYRLLRRLEPRAVVEERERMARDLPVAAHLLASALAAGASPVAAIDLVGGALGGPVAPQLRRIAAHARLGGDLASTWRSIPASNGLAPIARTVARALDTGAPLAVALDRLADDLRARQRFEVDRRARSVGVRAAAPLGICFLPAFLLIGVVPVVIGIATTIFATVG